MMTMYKAICVCLLLSAMNMYGNQKSRYKIPFTIQTPEQVRDLFPSTVAELEARVDGALEEAQLGIQEILAIPAEKRTFNNTMLKLDRLVARLGVIGAVSWALKNASPDASLRQAAEDQTLRITNFSVDALSLNPQLYQAVKEYSALPAEPLTAEEQKYLKETLEGFEKSGLNLPAEKQEDLKRLKKELAQLETTYLSNIASDVRTISVTRPELAGLDDSFIDALSQNDGYYLLGTDYPTYYTVIAQCAVESTRYNIWKAFNNRAYPENIEVLNRVVQLRDQLAKLLGFKSYAAYNLDDSMVKTPERVHAFLDELTTYTSGRAREEFEFLKEHLPAGVILDQNNHIKPWDLSYVRSEYKKKYFDVDEEKIKEYFPMQKTIDVLLDIYAQFLNIEFRQIPLSGLWHEDVRYIMIYSKANIPGTEKLLGHLLLDLHPRPFKYTNACQASIVDVMLDNDGVYHPPVLVVLANFAKQTIDRPSLLKRSEVTTFFHEFGHAMHALFGVTQMAAFSGTSVKRDFVEAPSQMLEQWLSDPAILKKVSSHYLSGEPLPDSLIEKFKPAKLFGAALYEQLRMQHSLLSLQIYAEGEKKDIIELRRSIYEKLFHDMFSYHEDDHFEASFGHLMGYGAQVYCYTWSEVFAQDMFKHIKKYGLLNYEIGKQYIEKVIGKGGSVDPELLLEDFLGRKPNMEAFLEDRGFVI